MELLPRDAMMDLVFSRSSAPSGGVRARHARHVIVALTGVLLAAFAVAGVHARERDGTARPPSSSPAVSANPSVDQQVQHGFDLAYNLDHEQALDALSKAAAQDPNDPGAQRALAVVTWLNLL